jgi:sec-independent protein translocase protein TatA
MGSLSISHWLVVGAALLLLLGGRGKITEMMGGLAEGIKSFKKGLTEDEIVEAPKADGSVKTIDHVTAGDIKQRAESETKV